MSKVKMSKKSFELLCKNIADDDNCLYRGEGCYDPNCIECWSKILKKYIEISNND